MKHRVLVIIIEYQVSLTQTSRDQPSKGRVSPPIRRPDTQRLFIKIVEMLYHLSTTVGELVVSSLSSLHPGSCSLRDNLESRLWRNGETPIVSSSLRLTAGELGASLRCLFGVQVPSGLSAGILRGEHDVGVDSTSRDCRQIERFDVTGVTWFALPFSSNSSNVLVSSLANDVMTSEQIVGSEMQWSTWSSRLCNEYNGTTLLQEQVLK